VPHRGRDRRVDLTDEAVQKKHPRRPATRPVPLGCILNFLQNHDQIGNRAFGERLAMLLPEAPLRLATAMLLLNPATPMLFMGEEHGATTPFLYFADWSGPLRQAVTEGRRKEFSHFAAFADPAARDRIPDPCDARTFERKEIRGDATDAAAATGDDRNFAVERSHRRNLCAFARHEAVMRLAMHAAADRVDGHHVGGAHAREINFEAVALDEPRGLLLRLDQAELE